MTAPFKYYLEDGELIRENVGGESGGQKVTFRNMAEICNYLSKIDKELWACRTIITVQRKSLEKVISLAKEIHDT